MDDNDMLLEVQHTPVRCYQMNSDIRTKTFLVAFHQIIKFSDKSVSWKTFSKDGITSAIGCLQIFSYKSQKSLFASTTQF